jgi:hypothetical protein
MPKAKERRLKVEKGRKKEEEKKERKSRFLPDRNDKSPFGLTELAYNEESCFMPDWNGLE